jgi:hypothetical protein
MNNADMYEHLPPIRYTIEFDPEDKRHGVRMLAVVCSQGDWSSEMSEDHARVMTDHAMHVQLSGHTHFYQYSVERSRGADVSATFNRKRR